MLDETILTKLQAFPTSSWALWNEKGDDSLEFFFGNINRLRNNVVFLGLNRSGKTRPSFSNFMNFHKKGHQGDMQLRRLLQGQNLTNLLGAYMTDLSEVFETNSKNVRIDNNASGARLNEQLEILNSNEFTLITFGGDVFKEVLTYYSVNKETRLGMDYARVDGKHRMQIFKVYHYSMNGFNNRNVTEKLPFQLKAINDFLR